jgi:predicted RNA binding protein YcfA (HicA-like mRNA interferase family)
MKSISGKDFARLLELNGWDLAIINGSYHIYIKEGKEERISLPVHGNTDLKLGLLKHLMKIADIETI